MYWTLARMESIKNAMDRDIAHTLQTIAPQGLTTVDMTNMGWPRGQACIQRLKAEQGCDIQTRRKGNLTEYYWNSDKVLRTRNKPDAAYKVKMWGDNVEIVVYSDNSMSDAMTEDQKNDLAAYLQAAARKWMQDNMPVDDTDTHTDIPECDDDEIIEFDSPWY